jgi:hypothetical protein
MAAPVRTSLWPGLAALALVTVYLIALLAVEKQPLIIVLLAVGIVAGFGAGWLGWLTPVSRSFAEREDSLGIFGIAALCVVAAWFREDHFVLLLIVTVML